jgi:vacuolar-type H+-ATPase subunit I/STV1
MNEKSSIQEETVLYSWDASVPVLTNPSAWSGVALSLGGGALGLGILFTFISKSIKGLYVAAAIFGGLMSIFVLVGGIIDIFGGFRVNFILTNLGLRSISGKGARAAAGAAVVGGILAGNLTAIGTGTLAESEQNVYIPYKEVTKVKVKSRRRYILVRGDWSQKPIGLYCDKDNFTGVIQLLQEQCPSAKFLR